VCSATALHSILYGFENEWARLRKIQQTPNGFAHALSYDMYTPAYIVNGDTDTTVNTMLLSTDPSACMNLTKRMLDLRTDATISVAEVGVPGTPEILTAAAAYGIFELATPTTFVRDHLELRASTPAPVPGGYVVHLRFAGARSKVTTSLPLSSYRVAKPRPDSALIYIVPPLDNTTPITITAEP
jgi:hypothetical protein